VDYEHESKLNLIYASPTEQEAREWAFSDGRSENVSGFACRYPGRYTEAADLARKILRISDAEAQDEK